VRKRLQKFIRKCRERKRTGFRGCNNNHKNNRNRRSSNRHNRQQPSPKEDEQNSEPKEKCFDSKDNDSDGFIDFADKDCSSKRPLNEQRVWYHSWRGPQAVFGALRGTPVNAIILSNVDFNEAPDPNVGLEGDRFQTVKEEITYLAKKGYMPIYERDLFFQDAQDSTSDFAQPFVNDFLDCSVLTNPDYYEWNLRRIQEEAYSFGTQYTAFDTEPYYKAREALMPCILNEDPVFFSQIRLAIQTALSREEVNKVDYVFPSYIFRLNTAFEALSALGKNPITETSYLNCSARLEWLSTQEVPILGVKLSISPQCYLSSAVESCFVENCPESTTALWSPQDVFQNEYLKKRGIMFFTTKDNELSVAIQLQQYCLLHPQKCQENS
ncbi:MAG: hypothetical protein D6780_07680, partial [Candidatus Dadabacteria bacterium]